MIDGIRSGLTALRDSVARSRAELMARHKNEADRQLLYDLGFRLSAASTVEEAAHDIMAVADLLFGWDACSFDSYEAESGLIWPVLTIDTIDGCRHKTVHAYVGERPSALSAATIAHGARRILREVPVAPQKVSQEGLVPFGDTGRPSASLMFVPIRHGHLVVGVLSVQSYTPDAYSAEDLRVLQALADRCGGAVHRIRGQETFREREAAMQHIMRGANCIFWYADVYADGDEPPSWVCRLLDDTAAQRFLPVKILPGQTYFQAWYASRLPEDKERTDRYGTEQLVAGRSYSQEFRCRTVHGEVRWLSEVVHVEVVHQGRWRAVGVCTDITARKQAEEARNQVEAQLLQAQKMEGIGRLAGGIAHDFNNLLTAIIGYTELAEETLEPEHVAQPLLENVQQAAQRAAGLTQQLLAFARKQMIQPRIVDINQLLASTGKLLRPLIGEDIELVTVLGTDLCSVRVDPHQLEQVMVNLAVNARDAMPNGGRLTMQTMQTTVAATSSNPSLDMLPGRYAVIRVSDTGTGMTPEVKSRLFEPFFTTKELGKGTGLGLATCYGIVRQSGGYIRVDSEPGRGTSFDILLPYVEESGTEQQADAESVELPRGDETILLVEDEPLVRGVAVQTLRAQGYTVLEATQGEEALQVARQNLSRIDLLVTDVVMPIMGGKELERRLRELLPTLKVIFTSGYTDGAITGDTVFEPGTVFVQKPFTPPGLARTVRAVLDARS